jgi:hypothetical protein
LIQAKVLDAGYEFHVHICYGIDSVEKLMYARGRLSALEALLQDIRNLQKEDIDGTIDKP